MNKKALQKAILGILGTAALSVVSSQAYALGVAEVNFGAFTGTDISANSASGKRSWADSIAGSNGLGWVHTGSAFAKLQVGSASDISNGVSYDMTFKISAIGTTATGMDNPSFSIWTSGANDFDLTATSIGLHTYSQVRGPSQGGVSDNAALASIGITDFIGYANSGNPFFNGDGDFIDHGGVNSASSSITNAAGSTWSYTQTTGLDYAMLTITGLKSGYYLMAAGGSCFDGTCTAGNNFKLDVSGSVSAVPVPGAVWLFGSAMAGLLGVSRRKRAA